MDKLILQDKIAVITGAASGIGKAIAMTYAKQGAKLVISDINLDGVKAVAQEITKKGGQAIAIKTDVAKKRDIDEMIDLAIDKYGKLDILVNNAGIMDNMQPVDEIDEATWRRIMDVNVFSVLFASKKAVQVFKKQANGGVIINIASVGGIRGSRAGVMYTASKHAVIGITKNIAYMYAKTGIRCNAIAPGGVNTNISSCMTNPSQFGMGRVMEGVANSPRMGEPEEIAGPALFLASDQSSLVNGAVLVADGGWTAY